MLLVDQREREQREPTIAAQSDQETIDRRRERHSVDGQQQLAGQDEAVRHGRQPGPGEGQEPVRHERAGHVEPLAVQRLRLPGVGQDGRVGHVAGVVLGRQHRRGEQRDDDGDRAEHEERRVQPPEPLGHRRAAGRAHVLVEGSAMPGADYQRARVTSTTGVAACASAPPSPS